MEVTIIGESRPSRRRASAGVQAAIRAALDEEDLTDSQVETLCNLAGDDSSSEEEPMQCGPTSKCNQDVGEESDEFDDEEFIINSVDDSNSDSDEEDADADEENADADEEDADSDEEDADSDEEDAGDEENDISVPNGRGSEDEMDVEDAGKSKSHIKAKLALAKVQSDLIVKKLKFKRAEENAKRQAAVQKEKMRIELERLKLKRQMEAASIKRSEEKRKRAQRREDEERKEERRRLADQRKRKERELEERRRDELFKRRQLESKERRKEREEEEIEREKKLQRVRQSVPASNWIDFRNRFANAKRKRKRNQPSRIIPTSSHVAPTVEYASHCGSTLFRKQQQRSTSQQ